MIISFEDDFGCFQFDNSLRKQFMLLILGIESKNTRFISVINIRYTKYLLFILL